MQSLISPFSTTPVDKIKVYVLGLKEKPNRLESAKKRLLEGGHPEKRITYHYGVYAKTNPDLAKQLNAKWNVVVCAGLCLAESACACAHLEALEKIAKSRRPFALVVEDDILLTPQWPALFTQALHHVPPGAEIVLLGWAPDKSSHNPFEFNKAYLKQAGYCCHCYLVTREGAAKITRMVKELGMREPIDNWLVEQVNRGRLKMYCLNQKYPGFSSYLVNDTTKNKSWSWQRDGIAYQDPSLGSNLEADRSMKNLANGLDKAVGGFLKAFMR